MFFFTGCNLRCPWCQNRELVLGGISGEPAELTCLEAGFSHLAKRSSVLAGVVLSGGEPSIYRELPDVIRKIKDLGFKVKLDTNGMNPQILELLFRHEKTRPDYIALDLKIAPDRYRELSPENLDCGERLIESAALIRSSGIDHEYRTLTLPDAALSENDIEALAPLVDSSPWYFRPFMPGNCLDPSWNFFAVPQMELVKNHAEKAQKLGKNAIGLVQ